MRNTIYCKPTAKGIHSFYLKNDGNEYFLFSQDYRKGVNDYYKSGVSLDRAADFTKSKFDNAIIKTMTDEIKNLQKLLKNFFNLIFF